MRSPFPTTDSTLDARALGEQVLPDYPIAEPTLCTLHMRGVNDVYRITTAGGARYFLKVYRFGWRSESEVAYELDLLAHLDRNGVGVCLPVARRNGDRIFPVPAIEGTRSAVLFEHAPGRPPTWPSYENEIESRRMGAALAAIHNAAEHFTSRYSRRTLDEALLLDDALAAAKPFLAHRPDDERYLVEQTERMRKRLAALTPDGLSRGVCHGDFHCGNVFLSDNDDGVTMFDFDVCGPGWLAFDLARWRGNTENKPGNSWDAFLDGSQEQRSLTPADRAAIPLFVALRTLDWLRIKATFVARGAWDGWDMDFFLNDTLPALSRWEHDPPQR